MRVYTRPLVPRHLFTFGETLHASVENHDSVFLLYHPKISVAVDPEAQPTQFRDLAFSGSVDLFLIDGMPDGVPYAAFDIYTEEKPTNYKEKIEFFHYLGISYRCMEASECLANVQEIAAKVSVHTPDVDRLRNAINPGQWAAMQRMEKIAGRKSLHLLHEVGLDQVIEIDQEPSEGALDRPPFLFDKRYLSATSFDALICTPPPNARPICVVEFDGHWHGAQSKQQNDRRKEAACIAARLPLVRIPAADVWMPSSAGSVVPIDLARASRDRAQRARFAWRVLTALIHTISDSHFSSVWYLHQLHRYIRLEADRIDHVMPDSAKTLNELANELWSIAQGKIARLEQQAAELEEVLKSRYEYDDVLADIHGCREEEESWRSTDADSQREAERIQELLQEDFEAIALRTRGPVRLFDFRFNVEQSAEGDRYQLDLSAGPLLDVLGLKFTPRQIAVGPLGIRVVGDHTGDVARLMERLPNVLLQRMALSIVEPYARAIQIAGDKNQWSIAALVQAEMWSKMLPESVENHIKRQLSAIRRADELDYESFTKEHWEIFGDPDNWSLGKDLPRRSVSDGERLSRLNDQERIIRLSIQYGGFEHDVRTRLESLLKQCADMVRKEITMELKGPESFDR